MSIGVAVLLGLLIWQIVQTPTTSEVPRLAVGDTIEREFVGLSGDPVPLPSGCAAVVVCDRSCAGCRQLARERVAGAGPDNWLVLGSLEDARRFANEGHIDPARILVPAEDGDRDPWRWGLIGTPGAIFIRDGSVARIKAPSHELFGDSVWQYCNGGPP